MSLGPGNRLGPYEITAPIGAGGMGEVYRAKDTRLDRTVAIKVLPSHLADNPDLKQRFEREARAVSSLNHPHICTLHDIGEQDGTDFLVMEYIEGETLGDRLKKGALPLDQALRYAVEIADALDKAHRQGVVHRDLKPGNIMLTKPGTKLLDFGLAKLARPPAEAFGEGGSALPTQEKPLTEKGAVLGTFQYMSPEQLEGKDADARTDIFAFGTLLYEMVTGKKAFEGKSQASLITAIMSANPTPVSNVQPMSPAALDHVVQRCLAKDPDERWQAASDVMLELKWIADRSSQVEPVVAKTSGFWKRAVALGLAVLLTAVVTAVAVWNVTRPEEKYSARFDVELFPHVALFENSGPLVALSPDGNRLAHVAGADARGESRRLYIRNLDRLEATPLSGTEDAFLPFFSPSGDWVGFFAEGKLKKVSVHGGIPIILCDAPDPRGGSWGPDDTIVFAPLYDTGLFQVPAAGGTPEALTTTGKGERSHRWPHFLPDGKAVLFISQSENENYDDASIEAVSLATGERKLVHEGGTQPRYAPTGHLVFARQERLFGAPFDLGELETTAPPAPIVDGIMSSTRTSRDDGSAQYAFTETGTLIYLSGGAGVEHYTLVWVDRGGIATTLSAQPGHYMTPRFSPNGRRLALSLDDNEDIWIYEMNHGAMTRLTFAPGFDAYPVWSPDGERLAFVSGRAKGPFSEIGNLFWKRADGTGEAERLTENENYQRLGAWSPNGRVLAFIEASRETNFDIWVLPLEGEHEPQLFLQTPFSEAYPRFSPDGRWLAYQSDESGRLEVYVQPYPGPGGRWQISTDGGVHPLWGPENELFYRWGDSMMVVSYSVDGESFRAGKPRELFQGQFRLGSRPFADISPDGKGFAMLKKVTAEEGAIEPTQAILVTNWFEELERLVPTNED